MHSMSASRKRTRAQNQCRHVVYWHLDESDGNDVIDGTDETDDRKSEVIATEEPKNAICALRHISLLIGYNPILE